MTESAPDPWRARLSELLDGELSAAEKAEAEAHLARCPECARTLKELAAVVRAARALPERAPERDLWPGLAAALRSESPVPAPSRASRVLPWLAFAAGVLATSAAFLLLDRAPAAPVEVARQDGSSYLLLLHEPAGLDEGQDSAEHAAVVERYSRWAQDLGARCLGGEELEARGVELRPDAGGVRASPLPSGERVGGYFLLAARDGEEAQRLAETCPHLERGGWVELRRIQPTPRASEDRR